MVDELKYSLQANRKNLEGPQHPDRDAQFRYLNEQIRRHHRRHEPVVSVDTKKKQLIGPYKNAGQTGREGRNPEAVNEHDFIDTDLGKAIPYGIYDLARNRGWVSVGIDHDTAAFAVASLRSWWTNEGRVAYPKTRRLLICADAGGSNSYRNRLWKLELSRLASDMNITITVCHFPPGTSKFNKIEHRLWSQVTSNWRGQPPTSREVIVSLNPPNSPSPLTRRAGFLQTSTVRTMWSFRPSPYCDTTKVGPRSMGRPSSRSTRKATE
jgi:hypothetical protein